MVSRMKARAYGRKHGFGTHVGHIGINHLQEGGDKP